MGLRGDRTVLRSRWQLPQSPSRPGAAENPRDVIRTLKETDAELGLAFDGDGDRLGVVTKDGEIILAGSPVDALRADVLSRACRAAR